MLLYTKLEITALRTLADGDRSIADWLFSRLKREHFSLSPSDEFFRRIQTLTDKSGNLPRWNELVADITITEDSRDFMEDQPRAVIKTRSDAVRVLALLEKYRTLRILMRISRDIAKDLKADKIDPSVVVEHVSEHLTRVNSATDWADYTTTYGRKTVDKRSLRELITPASNEFFPTGFVAFDSRNHGIPRGSVFVLAGETGAGKSLIATNIAVNQAAKGVRVSLTSLEMDRKQVNQRVLSKLSGIELNRILYMKKSDLVLRKQLIESWKEFNDRVFRNGGRFEIISPDEDVSMEELLARMRGRGFDNIVIDYMGLLKGMDEEDQWRKLGAATRSAKVYTKINACAVTILAQLSEEGKIRYSRTIKEHASLMWTWQRPDESGLITIKQEKTRQQEDFDFMLQLDTHHMRVLDVDMSKIGEMRGEKSKIGEMRGEKSEQKPKGNIRFKKKERERTKSRATDESERQEDYQL